MWLRLTQVCGLADKVMVCRGWGHPVPSNPCYPQEEGKRMAGMLSTHCHQQPPQQTSSSHSLLQSLNLASAFIWAATLHSSVMADATKPLHHALATQQSTPHLPFLSLWPQSECPSLSPTATQKCPMTEYNYTILFLSSLIPSLRPS